MKEALERLAGVKKECPKDTVGTKIVARGNFLEST